MHEIELELTETHYPLFGNNDVALRAPTQQRGDPQRQLTRVERFCEVIVTARLQAFDSAFDLAPGRQEYDRHAGAVPAHVARQRKPVAARHHDVEHEKVEGETLHPGPGVRGSRGRGNSIPLHGQIPGEQGANATVVVDDKEVR